MTPVQPEVDVKAWRLTIAVLLAAILVSVANLGGAIASVSTLHIAVTGVRSNLGSLDLCVFDTSEGFPDCAGTPSIARRRVPAVAGTSRFDVDVAPGLHAVSVLHDENGNGRLDTNFLGIPREGGAVSNNPRPRMGPPRFADATFQLAPEGGEIILKMVYP